MPNSILERLNEPEILIAPGAYDSFTARLIEVSGFEVVYLSGAGVSYTSLGQPDSGLVTQTQMVARVRAISDAVDLPLIADGDTGFGNAVNVYQTVQLYEDAGANAIQLEDQQFPKRCGHLSGKELVSAAEMAAKVHAAVDARKTTDFLIIARTDALTVAGLDEALQRAQLYKDAGADIIFVESPLSKPELQEIGEAFPKTLLMANMVEGGKTPILDASELQEMGFDLVIYPNSLTRRFALSGLALLEELKTKGTTSHLLDTMMPFTDLNQLLGMDRLKELEHSYLPRPDEKLTSP